VKINSEKRIDCITTKLVITFKVERNQWGMIVYICIQMEKPALKLIIKIAKK